MQRLHAPPHRRLLGSAAILALLASTHLAPAAPSLADKATAQALFEDGLQLMGKERYAEACPKLEESERLDPALGTRYRLAECEEATGRLASAWAGFLEVADLAHEAGQSERETLARARAAAVEPKLSRVEVDVTRPDTPGLKIQSGKKTVGRGQWGSAVPVDPGSYTIQATAPGRQPWSGSVEVSGDGRTSKLVVPDLEPEADSPAAGAIVAPSPPPALPEPEKAMTLRKPGPGRPMRIAGITLMGAGSAGVIAGVVMGFVAKSHYDGAQCGETCTAPGEGTIDRARQLGDASTAVFVVGAAAAVTGVIVFLAAPGEYRAAHSAHLSVGPAAFSLHGSF
jgi:hypothetical protein